MNLMAGHCPGRYVYAIYKTCGKVKRDYVGKIIYSREGKCQRSIKFPARGAELRHR
jgi:hypothetical protein